MTTEIPSENLKASNAALQDFIDDYVAAFETLVEDAEGRDEDYSPSEIERDLICDAIHGLICDDNFMDLAAAFHAARQEYRRVNRFCLGCGAPPGTHWGKLPGCLGTPEATDK